MLICWMLLCMSFVGMYTKSCHYSLSLSINHLKYIRPIDPFVCLRELFFLLFRFIQNQLTSSLACLCVWMKRDWLVRALR